MFDARLTSPSRFWVAKKHLPPRVPLFNVAPLSGSKTHFDGKHPRPQL
jgi:hypothetical protein